MCDYARGPECVFMNLNERYEKREMDIKKKAASSERTPLENRELRISAKTFEAKRQDTKEPELL